MVTVVDYGMGNVGSILNMLDWIGAEAQLTDSPMAIERASHVLLPGVGAFDAGMKSLQQRGLIPILAKKAAKRDAAILGICLGMQLFMEASEEGTREGLGWIKGKAVRFRFPADSSLKIPHMGWNSVRWTSNSGTFLTASSEEQRYYFAHSYYCIPANISDVLATSTYGHDFAAAVGNANIFGVQFHVEKSHYFGMKLLKSFVNQ